MRLPNILENSFCHPTTPFSGLPLYDNVGLRLSGRVSAAAQERQGIDENEEGEESPDEEAERNRRLGRAAVSVAVASWGAPVRGKGDGAGEPEDHGDPFEGQRHDAVEEARIVERRKEEVGEQQQGPDRVEDHEGQDAWRPPQGAHD